MVPDVVAAEVVGSHGVTARTGKIGNKIFALSVEQALQVRMGKMGDDTL